jgi:phage terminase small subunit
MGRQKESAAEKKAKGNPGKRKIVDDPEIQPILDSTPPEGMDENQIRYWNRYAPYMIKNKFLTDLNITDLISLCNYEVQRENVRQFLSDSCASLLQEKKNYHGDTVDLVESAYSKLSRNIESIIRVLKADLRIRTDKLKCNPVSDKPKSKFEGLLGGKK